MNLAHKIKNKALAAFVKAQCLKAGIPMGEIGNTKSFYTEGKPEMFILCNQIFEFAGIEEKYAHAALCGVSNIKCDGEISWGNNSPWNWATMYDLCMLNHTIHMADNFMNGDQRCEVGMKYPQFNAKKLIEKYGLTSTGFHEPYFSLDKPEDQKTFIEVWQNEDRTISFSFDKNKMGTGYRYAGATFATHAQALEFTKWFLRHKSFYIKDLDIFFNRLGGMCLSEIDKFNAEWKRERAIYLKEIKGYTKRATGISSPRIKKSVAIAKPVLVKKLKYAVVVQTLGKNPVRVIKV